MAQARPRERIVANLTRIAELQGSAAPTLLEASEAAPTAAATFTKDMTAWQNQSFASAVATESSRGVMLPFVIGGVVAFLLLGVSLPTSLPKEMEKSSEYWRMVTGAKDDHGHGDHGHGH
eukprot:CAMPEP_0198426616 /NCGR_PEP_ID=MMETSP1452-20131203/5373_1 /TAXON_ID=1181717 /ORGANISM="Synchroma pusillum, Strain CCMP3072" /LENGTH=119 /DNA_ID=CAMNT_0044146989 /DNA_START=90 /DNA_END=449 /DNA_ORIENTATION=+